MEVTLVVIRGKVNRSEIVFRPPAVLGRSREADLTIAHPMISRRHCELYVVDGLLLVRDLGSLNGTIVRGKKVVDSPLCPNDAFSVGPLSFQVRYQYNGDRSAIPPPTLAEPDQAEPVSAAGSVSETEQPEEVPNRAPIFDTTTETEPDTGVPERPIASKADSDEAGAADPEEKLESSAEDDALQDFLKGIQ